MKVKGLLTNIVCGCIGLALSAYVWIATASFPKDHISLIGSDFFPRLLAFGLAASSITMMAIAAITKKEELFEIMNIREKGMQRAVICLLATIAYALLIPRLSFILSSMLFLFGIMYMLKNRKWIQMTLIAVIVPIAVFKIFEQLLGILLPLGILKNILY